MTTTLSAADREKAAQLITRAKAKLVLDQPFYASLVLRRPLIESFSIPTAAADARGRVYYNPAFILSDAVGTVAKCVFLLAHETLHVAFHHAHQDVIGSRNQRACNIAMDKVINELLVQDSIGDFIEGGQRHKGAEAMKWQDLYNEDDGKGGGGGVGDDLIPCPDGEPSPAEAEELKQKASVELAQAAQAAKMQGKLSAGIERLVDDILTVKTPWYEILERFMVGFVSADYSWRRPNRRMMAHGMYLPGLSRVPTMGPMVIGVDTSGSIGGEELRVFSGHVNRIIEQCLPESVTVVYCDSEVAHVDTFQPDEYPVQLKPHGGGGTDLRNIIKYVNEMNDTPDCCVIFTDGYTPYDSAPPEYPVVWLVTTEMQPPWGETVRYTDD